MAKVFKTTQGAWSNIDKLQSQLDKNDREVGELLGCSGSVISKWRKEKKAPYTTGLAAEALLRRMGKKELLTDKTELLVVTGPSEIISAVETIAKNLGLRTVKV